MIFGDGEALGAVLADSPTAITIDPLHVIQTVGLPIFLVLAALWAVNKYYLPVWKQTKIDEQAQFHKRQEAYDTQSKAIIEIATRSDLNQMKLVEVVDTNTKALESSTKVLEGVVKTLDGLVGSMEKHDDRAEEMSTGIQRVLEHMRRE
jgi:hypothetical protein